MCLAWAGERKEVQLRHTCIEVNKEVQTFVVDDQDHPQMIEIHAEVQRLSCLMHDARYVKIASLPQKFIPNNSWESNHGEGCQSLSSLSRWYFFLHGLLPMPAVSSDNHNIKFILFTVVACL